MEVYRSKELGIGQVVDGQRNHRSMGLLVSVSPRSQEALCDMVKANVSI